MLFDFLCALAFKILPWQSPVTKAPEEEEKKDKDPEEGKKAESPDKEVLVVVDQQEEASDEKDPKVKEEAQVRNNKRNIYLVQEFQNRSFWTDP